MLRWRVEKRAATLIQKIFRGHKGRECREIEKELARVEGLARPLLALLKTQEEEEAKRAKVIWRLEYNDRQATDELVEIERELELCNESNQKYTDSARISKTPQRYITKYLRIRLKDHLAHEKVALITPALTLTPALNLALTLALTLALKPLP